MTSLLDFVEEYRGALEADLIRAGLRLRDLGTHRLTWGDLKAFIAYLPPGCAVQREQDRRAGTTADREWTLTNQLLAALVDEVRFFRWGLSEDGQAGRNRPRQIPRPGVEDDSVTTIGADPVPLPELRSWLGPLAARFTPPPTTP